MANQSTNITLTSADGMVTDSFYGTPGLQRGYGPRARNTWYKTSTVPATTAADTRTVTIQWRLDSGYGYCIAGLSLMLAVTTSQVDAGYFDDIGLVTIDDSRTVGNFKWQTAVHSKGVVIAGNGITGSSKVWEPVNFYKPIFYNLNGSKPTITIVLQNTDSVNAQDAGTLYSSLSLLQYDLEQAISVESNAAAPVRL